MADHATANDLLFSALQERGFSFKRDTIEAELQNGSQQAQWVTEHVSPHTLLSKDEAALTKALERSGVLETFLRQPGLASTRPLTEDELRAATATLKSSTATCAKQIATLKYQLELTGALQKSRQEADRGLDRYMDALNRQHLLEKQRTKAMAEDVMTDFESRMLEYQQQKNTGKRQQLQNVSSQLTNDDDVLAKAERLAAELELTEMDEQTEKRALELISILSYLTSEEIRCRLDRLYLEELLADTHTPADFFKSRDDCLALEEDLESLYAEIEVLAEMSARQEFGQPILDELQKKRQNFAYSLEDTFDMILNLLSEMTHSTKQELDRLLYRQSHCEVLDQLSILFKEEISDKQVEQIQSKRSHRRESSISSLRTQKSRPTQPQSPSQSQLQTLESFLRRLGISTAVQGQDSLTDMVSEKRSEMAEILHYNLRGISAEMPLLTSLGSSDEAKELLTSTLQAAGSYAAEPSLVDQVQKRHLTELEEELMAIQKRVEGVDLSMLVESNRSREKFLENWERH